MMAVKGCCAPFSTLSAFSNSAAITYPKYFFPGKKYFGYVMAAELENADKVLKGAQHPFTAIMGGAKVSDKILMIENVLDKADNILIGGGMPYTFLKAMG